MGRATHLTMGSIAAGSLAEQTRWMDARQQAELVRTGEVSAGELLEAAIERIEALDPTLNAVIIRWFDEATAQALALQRELGDGTGDAADPA